MGQHVKESARNDAAATEPVDETLSVVRQMLAEAKQDAPEKPAPKQAVAAAAHDPAPQTARQNPQERITTRGRAALPPLEAPEVPPNATRKITHNKAPERHPLSSPQSRVSRLWSRVGGVFSRRGRGDVPVDPGQPAQAPAQAMDQPGQPVDTAELTLVQRAVKAVKEFRPTRKQIALFTLLVVMVWRPWLIPGLVFVLFWVGLIAYLTLGPDRISEIAAARWEWFQRRHPERAEAMLGKVQRGADRVDGWLARLPESWTDGIYLPDFGRSASESGALDDQPDPFDRLAAERQGMTQGAGQV